ncbi:hypothetical protein LRS13_13785 [Svornostia abyssi]|uniref:Uncharacterized protein n=1 Tax=Svornostia abyssi TaxID=2898438 RepID=A0ABY5PBB8_9ACTN|nr:hypothetical protein LRS13_13785 [Parviterribacteraceae bacterium J379]
MGNYRKVEAAFAIVAVTTALLVAILAEPPPPLLDAVEAEGWARAIEFGLVTFALLSLLAAVGILRSKISIGPSGVTAERLVLEASRDSAEAVEHLGTRVKDLATIVDLLAQQNDDLQRQLETLQLEAGSTRKPRGLPEHRDG